ncbi:hypothetical protein [Terrilactibacillus laevilacticus]|uniref:DUF3329 domain-containing protein n=1 Tax=Terrilactibacillus laevilacticus TaxID=1380157 RepID=A0ABW5PQK5_9BACI|nr:hypothetical protein [Terrilactibacillus laevilacticus]
MPKERKLASIFCLLSGASMLTGIWLKNFLPIGLIWGYALGIIFLCFATVYVFIDNANLPDDDQEEDKNNETNKTKNNTNQPS